VVSEPASFGIAGIDSIVDTLEGARIEKLIPTYHRHLTESGGRLERTYILHYTSDIDPQDLVSVFSSRPEFEAVLVSRFANITEFGTQRHEPLDSMFANGYQWNLDSANDSLDIDAPEAWAIERGDENLIIGINDVGTLIDTTETPWFVHPDIGRFYNPVEDWSPYGAIDSNDIDWMDDTPGPGTDRDIRQDNVIGWNFRNHASGASDSESHFWWSMPQNTVLRNDDPGDPWAIKFFFPHGLAVESIAAAKDDGGRSLVGVAPGCRVYHVRYPQLLMYVATSILHTAVHSRVINISWGEAEDPDLYFFYAVNTATATFDSGGFDCVVVAATGNADPGGGQHLDVQLPAAYNSVLAVGSMAENLDLWSESAWGPDVDDVSVVAPVGTGIPAHWHEECNYFYVGDPRQCKQTPFIVSFSGTSGAAPQAAGVAALIRSRFPDLNQFQVKQRIKRSAEFYWEDTTENRKKFGYGKVNAYRALTEWGEISGNVTWDPSDTRDGAYYISGDLTIPAGASLTINPGTVVKVAPDHEKGGVDTALVEIIVEGELNIGSTGSPVVFESFTDTTSMNRDWWGIVVADGASAVIDNVVIRNAYFGVQTRSSMTIKNTLIEDCARLGLSIAGDCTGVDSVYAENVTIRDVPGYDGNDGIGVNLLGKGAALRLKNCVIEESDYGILAYTDAKLYMEGDSIRDHCLWGIGVYNGADATMSGVTVENNEYIGLRAYNGASLTATGCTFASNDWAGAYINPFGAVHPSATFSGCTFSENGDGLRVSSTSNVTLFGSEVVDQTSAGVYCLDEADIVVDSTLIDGNAAGVSCDLSAPEITECTIQYNVAGISANNSSSPLVRSNQILYNTTGLYFINGSNADMDPWGGFCPDSCGCEEANTIRYSVNYHVVNLNEYLVIDAACIYYGPTVKAKKFYGDVVYTPYLTEEPDPPSVSGYEGEEETPSLPTVYALSQNYPNPFNPTTTIRYAVPPPGGRVSIRIFNVQGQLVRTLVEEASGPGYHTAHWFGEDNRGWSVASGVYFVQMLAPEFKATKKLLILK